jgi:hypothetical protein
MRILDFSSYRDATGRITLGARLGGILRNGFGWQTEIQLQDRIVDRFGKVLGDEFIMLRSATVPGVDVPIPLVLIGPFGLRVMDTTAIRGTFRAKGDQWMGLNPSGGFRASRPNLAARLRVYGEIVRRSLVSRGLMMPEAEPVLLVARPESYVENIKSPVRVVLADGVENFATSLAQSRPLFPPDVVEDVARALRPAPTAAEGPAAPELETPARAGPTAIPVEESPVTPPARRGLTARHWLLLGLMLILDLCVLGVLGVMVWSSLRPR